MNMPTSITLNFLAPIAIKSQVTVLYMESAKLFGGWQPADPLVYDHQSGILYGPGWMPLELTPEEARELLLRRLPPQRSASASGACAAMHSSQQGLGRTKRFKDKAFVGVYHRR
jgi:hypothetical protein